MSSKGGGSSSSKGVWLVGCKSGWWQAGEHPGWLGGVGISGGSRLTLV